MASNDREITFLKNNLSDFERRGSLIIVIYSHTVVPPLCCHTLYKYNVFFGPGNMKVQINNQ
jgi:hypothetical protein